MRFAGFVLMALFTFVPLFDIACMPMTKLTESNNKLYGLMDLQEHAVGITNHNSKQSSVK